MEAIEFFQSIWAETSPGIAALLFVLGIGAFILSTIAGGGGSLVMVPVLNWLIGLTNTAPVLNLGSFLGRPARLVIFWNHIQWKVCLYYAPAALLGAWIASWLFASFQIAWLQVFVGVFLVSTIFQYRFGKKERSFEMRLWYFIPLGFLISVLGTLIGALGPVLNPFYLNYGIDKEDLIATKTANSFLMGLSQIGGYTFFGLLHDQYWIYGITLGLGATIGNIVGKRFLAHMKTSTFRKWMIALMVVSGILLIFDQMKNLF